MLARPRSRKALALASLLATAAVSCSSPAPAGKSLTFAWIPKSLDNPVFEVGHDGALLKAKELTQRGPNEVKVVRMASKTSIAEAQVEVVDAAIAQKVDAIGISCNDPLLLAPAIDRAVDAGIPVMTWDSDAASSKRFTYLGISNEDGGRAAARLMAKLLGDKGRIALLSGGVAAANLRARIGGFEAELASHPGMTIVERLYCDDDRLLATKRVEEGMQLNPDGWFFVGIWHFFESPDGAEMPTWRAATEAGRLKNVAFDTLPMELRLMDGERPLLHALVGQKYWGWGYDTVQMLYDHRVSGKMFPPWTDSGMDIVCHNNFQEMLAMWTAGDFTAPLPACDML